MISSRQDIVDFTLRRNGYPVVDNNLNKDQLDDCLDLTLQMCGVEESDNPWNDLKVKLVATELVRQQWAVNLMKYKGVKLLGDVEFNALELYHLANDNLKHLLQ